MHKKAPLAIILILSSLIIASNKPLITESSNSEAPLAQINTQNYFTEFHYPSGYLESIDNGTTTVYLTQDAAGYDYLVSKSANTTINDSRRETDLSSAETFVSVTSSTIGTESTDIIASWVEAPAYWDRGSAITIRVGFKSYLSYTFTVSVTVKCEIYDRYWSPNKGNYEKLEASGQKSTTLTLRPRVTKYVYVSVSIGYTTVGLKKIVVRVTGDLQYYFDEGYNFVQRFNRNEFNSDELPDYAYELSDIYHFNKWSIIRKAGEAVDYWDESMTTPYKVAKKLNTWIHDNFQYTKTSIYFYYTWGDERIMENYDGKYHGVCDEYAVLFISFARAINIPARQIYVKHGSEGHEFAEIWNGNKWVHADPAGNYYDDPGVYERRNYYIDKVYILVGANDSICERDSDGDGIIYYWEYNDWINYSPNPYQW